MRPCSYTCCVAIVGVLTTTTSRGEFVGFDILENKEVSEAAASAADPEGGGLRVFNFYARFDGVGGPGVSGSGLNKVVSVGQISEFSSFGINKASGANSEAVFFQEELIGSNYSPNPVFFEIFPALEIDTYVGLGLKTSDANSDTTQVDPDFMMTSERVFGGWFNSGGDNGQAEAQVDEHGFSVFIAQITILGLDPLVDLGSFVSRSPTETGGETLFRSNVFEGEFIIFPPQEGGGQLTERVRFEQIPATSTLAVLSVAGLAAGRRRRA